MKKEAIRTVTLGVTLLVGVLWAVVVLFLILVLGGWGFTSFRGGLLSAFGIATMFAAPICLICGSILALLRKALRSSLLACALGAVCLTVVVGSSIYDQFHLNSAQIPSSALYLSTLVAAARCTA